MPDDDVAYAGESQLPKRAAPRLTRRATLEHHSLLKLLDHKPTRDAKRVSPAEIWPMWRARGTKRSLIGAVRLLRRLQAGEKRIGESRSAAVARDHCPSDDQPKPSTRGPARSL